MKIPDFIGGGSEIGYESPITLIVGEMETKMENDTMQIIQRYGIDVDKEELLKALKYDRDQYDKGYRNGHIDGVLQGERLYARPIGKWIYDGHNSTDTDTIFRCSVCCREIHTTIDKLVDYPFCHCGADMRKDGEEEGDAE